MRGRSVVGRRDLLAGGAAWAAASLALLTGAAAHPSHGEGLYAALVGVDAAPPGAVGLRVLIVNNTGGAVTLRGLAPRGGAPVAIVRNRTLLGLDFSQPVDFLRVDFGARMLLAAPGYTVLAEDLDIDAVIGGAVELVADFGPLGSVVLEVVGAPQTTE